MNMLNPNDEELRKMYVILRTSLYGRERWTNQVFFKARCHDRYSEWVGLDSLPADIKDLKEDKTTLEQLVKISSRHL